MARRISFEYPHIDVACVIWGRQRRKIDFGSQGYPPYSTLGKLIEEGFVGAAQGKMVQHCPEVFHGEGAAIAQCIKALPGKLREALYFYYVIFGITHQRKAHILGIHVDTFTDRLLKANRKINEGYPAFSHFYRSDSLEILRSQA